MLKDYLLSLGCFIDNKYLDEYLDLIKQPFTLSGYSEQHHIIPITVYKTKFNCKTRRDAEKISNADPNNKIVTLLWKDHCLAHWLLYNCTIGRIKSNMAKTFIRMVENKEKLKTGFTNKELADLQHMQDTIRLEDNYFWSDSDIEFLKLNFYQLTISELATALGKTKPGVSAKAKRLGLKKQFKWSNSEINFLKANYTRFSKKELASKLSRTDRSIQQKLLELNLLKPKRPRTAEEISWLKTNYKKLSPKQCAEYLGWPIDSVYDVACKLKLTKSL